MRSDRRKKNYAEKNYAVFIINLKLVSHLILIYVSVEIFRNIRQSAYLRLFSLRCGCTIPKWVFVRPL